MLPRFSGTPKPGGGVDGIGFGRDDGTLSLVTCTF
jgi:hypothetical protein